MMDFGGLDDILDQDIGYIPTAIKREDNTSRSRPVSMSRQNSTKSIGSIKQKQEDTSNFLTNNRSQQNMIGLVKESPKSRSTINEQQVARQPTRRNTLFGAHKQTANIVQNPSNQNPISFQDFFKNQSNPSQNNSSKPPLPQRKMEKMSSFTQLSSPENIIDEDMASGTSRRGRPPLNRRNLNNLNNDSQLIQNRSQNLGTSKGFNIPNQSQQSGKIFTDFHQQHVTPVYNNNTNKNNNNQNQNLSQQNVLNNQSIEELKKVFSNQLQHQKQSFEMLIKNERQSHNKQIQRLKQHHQQQLKKRLQIKDFQIQKMKQFYELQLRIYKERQIEIRQYTSISKKLQSNIETIEKMERHIKDNQTKSRKDKQDQRQFWIQRKEQELKQKENQLNHNLAQLERQQNAVNLQKQTLNQSINQQKSRLYQLQLQLRRKQSQLQIKYKKQQNKLIEEHQIKIRQLQRQKQQNRSQQIEFKQQKNIIQIQKLELINARKQWDLQKKNILQNIHQQKTKVLQKQIQLASRSGQVQIKQQQIEINQNQYINKLKLIELQKKKIEIQKKNSKGQLYLNSTSLSPLGIKNYGLTRTSALNKTSQLNKQFYSGTNDQYEHETFENQTSFKKSVTQMRDEFLKSLPKF